jgi:hypothetical protein
VKQAFRDAQVTLFVGAPCVFTACARHTQPRGTVTVLLQWLNTSTIDTLILEAQPTPLHRSLTHDVPAGAMALEGYMLGSTEPSTMFGWVNAQESPRLPVFTEINAVPNLLERSGRAYEVQPFTRYRRKQRSRLLSATSIRYGRTPSKFLCRQEKSPRNGVVKAAWRTLSEACQGASGQAKSGFMSRDQKAPPHPWPTRSCIFMRAGSTSRLVLALR